MRTEDEVVQALAKKYAPPAYAFLRQVANRTGGANRTADALAMCLWKSQGFELIGFEVKVSRGDWLNEVKHPEKADPILRYCDRWFIVTGSRDIIKAGELPEQWGWIAPRGDGMEIVRKAPYLKPAEPPREFLAAILRRFGEQYVPGDQVAEMATKRAEDRMESARVQFESRYRDLVALEDAVRRFEEVSGLDIRNNQYQVERIGEVVKLVMGAKVEEAPMELMKMSAMMKALTARLDGFLTAWGHGADTRCDQYRTCGRMAGWLVESAHGRGFWHPMCGACADGDYWRRSTRVPLLNTPDERRQAKLKASA